MSCFRIRFLSVFLCFVYFLFVVVLVVSTSAIDCLEKLVFEMTYYVSSGTLNPTHSLTLIFVECVVRQMWSCVRPRERQNRPDQVKGP